MNPNDKTTSAEQDPLAQPDHVQNANQSHQTSRRRLLKAATVAPIIYTLPSGGALAATSSSCLNDSDNIITGVTKQTEQTTITNTQCNPGKGNAQANSSACNQGTGQNLTFTSTTTETETDKLIAGEQVFTSTGNPNEYHSNGKDYIYEPDSQTLIAGSCWNSINLSTTKTFNGFL
ncbi:MULTISPECIES: hypothetical protein [unclassified Ectothiorhodospira]|uniref:hypothetical protein n=1 Tax=unclassified Ectothiorhodospira TaxID=2684909 RepID=UPI001EE984FE|nr:MULTISPECIES: hypothetical protein [unclassified Ectothiorhodospira]MCG5517323.1 hypothetical protein [Ectothiorhodospira sp. 9100]MCG5520018.1 hypothetical protein [Ectothiorhodospira sp. 9905]